MYALYMYLKMKRWFISSWEKNNESDKNNQRKSMTSTFC